LRQSLNDSNIISDSKAFRKESQLLSELNERERTILKILSERGGVSVSALSTELGLSRSPSGLT
jgi:uncharacterized membrane protein